MNGNWRLLKTSRCLYCLFMQGIPMVQCSVTLWLLLKATKTKENNMQHVATLHKLTLTKFVPEDQLELQKYIMISLMCCAVNKFR